MPSPVQSFAPTRAAPPVDPIGPLEHGLRPSFRAALAGQQPPAGGSVSAHLLEAARDIAQGQHRMEGALRDVRRGRKLEQEDLLALQAQVYQHSQDVELASKIVDKVSSAVRTALQSQQ